MPAKFLIITFFIVSFDTEGQEQSRVSIDAGIILRRTIFYYKDVSGTSGPLLNPQAPYSHENGIDGLGVNTTVTYLLMQDQNINVNWGTTVRYDFYRFVNDVSEKAWYVDQSFYLTKRFNVRYHSKQPYIGVGISLINIGKDLNYTLADGTPQTLQLHFDSFDIIAGTPIWKLYFEPKFSWVPDDFPGSIKKNANLLTLRLYYKFEFKK